MNGLPVIAKSLVTGVRAINRKYAKPQIEMTWFVKLCLLMLRLYLFVLVGLLIYKFTMSLR
jgi:hypothetical protein